MTELARSWVDGFLKRINLTMWILKVVSGILLFSLLGIHFLANHLYSRFVIPPDSILYSIIIVLLCIHILTALRDLLIEAGMNRVALYSLLALVALVVALPPFLAANSLQNIVSGENVKENTTNCIEDPEWMVHSHKSLLLQWREEVVREGNRSYDSYEKSFDTCFSCHSYKKFCYKCHNEIGVQPRCFDCHITPPE